LYNTFFEDTCFTAANKIHIFTKLFVCIGKSTDPEIKYKGDLECCTVYSSARYDFRIRIPHCLSVTCIYSKVKSTPVVPMQAQRRRGRYRPNPFATSTLEGCWQLAPRPGCFAPLKDSVLPLQEVRFASGPVWMETEILAHTGIPFPDLPIRNELQCNSLKQCNILHALPAVILKLCVHAITVYTLFVILAGNRHYYAV